MNKIVIIVGLIVIFALGIFYCEGYDNVEWTLVTTCETLGPRYEVLSSITDEASGSYDYEWFTWHTWDIQPLGVIPIDGPAYAGWNDNGDTLVYYQGFGTVPKYDGQYTINVKQHWTFTRVR